MTDLLIDPTGPSAVQFGLGALGWELLPSVLTTPGGTSLVDFPDGSVVASDGSSIALWIGGGPLGLYDGYILLDLISGQAALGDFAIWQLPDHDPAMALIDTSTSGTLTAGVDEAWTRHHFTIYAPGDSVAWSRAAYAAVGVIYKNVPVGGVQHLDDVQWEMAPLAANMPTAYRPARSLQVRVRPTRLNLCTNPSFETTLKDWEFVNGTGSAFSVPDFDPPVGSVMCRVAPTGGSAFAHTVRGLVPGRSYTASAYVRNELSFDIKLVISGARGEPDKASPPYSQTPPVPGNTFDWRRLSVTFVADTATAKLLVESSGSNPGGTSFHLDGVLVEEGRGVGDYFDGDSGSPDYVWEMTGTPGNARSYYYRDKINRHYSLGKTLRENVAQGIFVEDPVYATSAIVYATSAIPAPSPYGSGLYGDGPYGG